MLNQIEEGFLCRLNSPYPTVVIVHMLHHTASNGPNSPLQEGWRASTSGDERGAGGNDEARGKEGPEGRASGAG